MLEHCANLVDQVIILVFSSRLLNAVKNNKKKLDALCREFDLINPKTHKYKFDM